VFGVLRLLIIIAAILGLNAPIAKAEEPQARPLTLDDCLKLAESNNADIKIARERVEEADAVYRGKLGSLLPQIDANLSYNRYTQELSAKKQRFGDSLNDYYAELVVKLPVFQGRDWGLVKEAKNNLEAEKQKLEQIRRAVILSVKKGYYERASAAINLDVQKELLKGLEEQFSIAKLLYAGGKFSAIDVLKVETQVATSKAVLESMENTLRVRSLTLGRILGGDHAVETAADIEDITGGEFKINTGCVDNGFRTNPERLAAEYLLEKSQSSVMTAFSGHLPYLSLFGNYNWEDKTFFPGNPNANVGIALTIPIFHGGTVTAAVSEAQSRTRQYEIKLRDTGMDLTVRFEASRATATDSINRLSTTSKALSLAENAYKASRLKYKSGTLSTLELLDTQTVWYNSRLTYKRNVVDCLIALAEITQLCPDAVTDQRGTKR
jgi:outer membrane protein